MPVHVILNPTPVCWVPRPTVWRFRLGEMGCAAHAVSYKALYSNQSKYAGAADGRPLPVAYMAR